MCGQQHAAPCSQPFDRECGWLWCTRAAGAGRGANGKGARRDGNRGREAREPEARARGRRRRWLKRQHGPGIHLRLDLSSGACVSTTTLCRHGSQPRDRADVCDGGRPKEERCPIRPGRSQGRVRLPAAAHTGPRAPRFRRCTRCAERRRPEAACGGIFWPREQGRRRWGHVACAENVSSDRVGSPRA